MSGHNKWTQIKHKKTSTDQARGKLFSKLAGSISIAARNGVDPQFNPALRSAIEQAKKHNMPNVNVERAIKRASESNTGEQFILEVYGPGGVGILVDITTDNKDRTLADLRALFKKHDAKLAARGSVLWSFEKSDGGYIPKFPARVSQEVKSDLMNFISFLALEEGVSGVYAAMGSFSE